MATLPHAHIIGIFLPCPLPVDEDIHVLLLKHDTLDLELKRDGMKSVKVHLRLSLKLFRLLRRQQEGMKPRPIFTLVGVL